MLDSDHPADDLDPSPASPSVIARSIACEYCGEILELTDAPDAVWTCSMGIGVSGQNPQCHKAPNPDDGPMPGHRPTVIAWRDQQPPPPPAQPYAAPVIPHIPPTNHRPC